MIIIRRSYIFGTWQSKICESLVRGAKLENIGNEAYVRFGLMKSNYACVIAAVALLTAPQAALGETVFASSPKAQLPEDVADLPLVVKAAPGGAEPLVVWLSGDGGWGRLERDVEKAYPTQGAPLVGLNSLRYFWKRRSPSETAAAVDRIVRVMGSALDRQRFVLVGFSFGADITPLVAERLSPDVRARLARVLILSPSSKANYRAGPLSWLGLGGKDPVGPAIRRLQGVPVVCISGDLSGAANCPSETAGRVAVYNLSLGHALKGASQRVVQLSFDPTP